MHPCNDLAFEQGRAVGRVEVGAMKVLVAYASKYGATEGIAERIGDVLRRRDLEVDVRRCKDLDDATGFDAYVVGSAAYMFRWRKDARKFVRRNAEVLATRPVWLFSSGPVGTERVDAKGNDVLAGAMPKEFAEFESTISPRGMQVFFGAFQLEKLRGVDRMAKWAPAEAMPVGDFRDWDAVEAWAGAIADELVGSAARD
jgi:menaquinone-dependent protoporphyrinogen oxidase